jgi:hypothetical protein
MSCRCGRHKTEAGCAGARYLSTRTRAERVAHGREGGRTHAVIWADQIVARYAHLDRNAAILKAWHDAREVWKHRRDRGRRRIKADAAVGAERR